MTSTAPNTIAAVLGQYDQTTQLQALELLRQMNNQQQLQQMQQLQQIQHMQTLKALQKMQEPKNVVTTTSAVTVEPKKIISTAMKLPTPTTTTVYSSCSMTRASSNSITNVKSSVHAPFTTPIEVKKEKGPDGEEFVVPSKELVDQVVHAAEDYFSDANLAKDHYLLRQICQKSEGFLSIKLLTALKNVKRLTKDWRVTSFALRQSTELELNAEQTKVKRIAALPDYVLKARQITNVIAIKIPPEFNSVSAITQLFAQYGNVTLVRVLLPGRQVPCDLRNYATQVPDMGTSLCAVVEFDTEEEACTACRELNGKRYTSGLRSALLGPRLRRNLYKIQPDLPAGENGEAVAEKQDSWSGVVKTEKKESVDEGKVSADTTATTPSKKDSGCDTASQGSSSPPTARKLVSGMKFDRAPGAHRKSVTKLTINIQQPGKATLRQPKGPAGVGFSLKRQSVIC